MLVQLITWLLVFIGLFMYYRCINPKTQRVGEMIFQIAAFVIVFKGWFLINLIVK